MYADQLAAIVVSIAALGMALAFFVADRDSPTSRMLSLFLAWLGASIALDVLVALPYRQRYGIPAWHGLFAWPPESAPSSGCCGCAAPFPPAPSTPVPVTA